MVAREESLDEKHSSFFQGISTQHVLKSCCLPVPVLLYAEIQLPVTASSQKCHILSQYSAKLLDHFSCFSVLLSYENYCPILIFLFFFFFSSQYFD